MAAKLYSADIEKMIIDFQLEMDTLAKEIAILPPFDEERELLQQDHRVYEGNVRVLILKSEIEDSDQLCKEVLPLLQNMTQKLRGEGRRQKVAALANKVAGKALGVDVVDEDDIQ